MRLRNFWTAIGLCVLGIVLPFLPWENILSPIITILACAFLLRTFSDALDALLIMARRQEPSSVYDSWRL